MPEKIRYEIILYWSDEDQALLRYLSSLVALRMAKRTKTLWQTPKLLLMNGLRRRAN